MVSKIDDLAAVFATHLCPASGETSNDDEAFIFYGANVIFKGSFNNNYDREREIAKLEKIWRLSKEMSEIMGSLHSTISTKLMHSAYELTNEEFESNLRKFNMEEIDRRVVNSKIDGRKWEVMTNFSWLPQAVFNCMTKLKRDNSATTPGPRINWDGVGAVHDARLIWDRRRPADTAPAPAKGLNEASPFGRFLVDVFEVLELGNPRAAFDAWVKVQS